MTVVTSLVIMSAARIAYGVMETGVASVVVASVMLTDVMWVCPLETEDVGTIESMVTVSVVTVASKVNNCSFCSALNSAVVCQW